MPRRRLPAEWEAQAGVLLAWPDAQTDWTPRLDDARREYAHLITAISARATACVATRHPAAEAQCRSLAAQAGADDRGLAFARADYDDTWIRDYGPLAVLEDDDGARLLDFRFDGWGGRFDARRDDAVTRALHEAGCFGDTPLDSVDFVMEGGAIDTDGRGTFLTTEQCWRARHPSLGRPDIEARLARHLGADRVLWLEHGHLEGDDTDAHVDTLARFLDPGTIAFQQCDDPADPHHPGLASLREQLRGLRAPGGEAYRLVPLPWPGEVLDGDRRLPASYANCLFVNGALLVPAFGVDADDEALRRLRRALPRRVVTGVPSRTLIWQNGGLHCATMQLPAALRLFGQH